MSVLTREEIQKSQKWDVKSVDIPDLGECLIRNMTGADGAKLIALSNPSGTDRDDIGLMCELIIASLCDEEGKLILKPEDVEMLRSKPFRALEALATAITNHNGLADDDDAPDE